MYNSTKEYVKRSTLKLMDQCGITLEDVRIALDELEEDKNYLTLKNSLRNSRDDFR